MATKWEVNRAVRGSDLPPPSRLIMLTLSDIAEAGTAEVPVRRTPSLRVLATETGLDEATVKRHLAKLDAAGWLKRTVPSVEASRRGERTRYQLLIPIGQGAEDAHPDEAGRTECPPQGAEDAPAGRTVRPIDKEDDRDDRDDHFSSPTATKATTKKPKRAPKPEPDREDVTRVCQHMIDRLKANEFKAPRSISDEWRKEARLLIDADGRTEEQVHRAIDWATSHSFWKSNVKSIPKLRAQYDTLRAQAEHEQITAARRAARTDPATRPSTTDTRVNGAFAAGAAAEATLKARALQQQQRKEITP